MTKQYEDVAVLRDPDGVICVITKRVGTSVEFYSYMFCKEFERDGKVIRSNFLSRRHTEAVRRLTIKIEEWLDSAIDRDVASRQAAR
jgi:hypothetical protein